MFVLQQLCNYCTAIIVIVFIFSAGQEYTATTEVVEADYVLILTVLQSSRFWNYNFMPLMKLSLHLFISSCRYETWFIQCSTLCLKFIQTMDG
jgi:hypothetical protein